MEDYSSKQVIENLDDPPNSRLFVVTSRSISEEELRDTFSIFGEIQGVWVVKDKQTKEPKGISYVKFARSSQACLAMEEMHGKVISEGTKPIKVKRMASALVSTWGSNFPLFSIRNPTLNCAFSPPVDMLRHR